MHDKREIENEGLKDELHSRETIVIQFEKP